MTPVGPADPPRGPSGRGAGGASSSDNQRQLPNARSVGAGSNNSSIGGGSGGGNGGGAGGGGASQRGGSGGMARESRVGATTEVNADLRGERGVAGGKPGTTGRWYHDMYNEDDQAPKSRQELIAYYGYDPRTRDSPPPITQIRCGRKSGSFGFET